MQIPKSESPIYTGQPFELLVRSPETGDLFDFSGYEVVFAGKASTDSDAQIFRYTDADTNEVNKTPVTVDATEWNIQLQIPESKVLEIHQGDYSHIYIGVWATPIGGGDSMQIIPALKVEVFRGVAP